MRCRPGIVTNTTFAKVPEQRRTASLRSRCTASGTRNVLILAPMGSSPRGDGRGNIPGTARASSGVEETGERAGRGDGRGHHALNSGSMIPKVADFSDKIMRLPKNSSSPGQIGKGPA